MSTKGLLTLSCATVVSLAATIVPAAQTRPQTTTPGVIYIVKVTLTDKTITIAKDKFTRNGVSRLPRGAQIRYSVTNKGTRPYAWRVWGAATPVIKPGGRDSIFVNWQFRGTYRYELLFRGKPAGPKGHIVIF
ncbi:MAG: hypothetical protein M3Q30_27580 [Actinomycetota bacterium]|nr:hypothetical protein [Actinomycetota bacterium]